MLNVEIAFFWVEASRELFFYSKRLRPSGWLKGMRLSGENCFQKTKMRFTIICFSQLSQIRCRFQVIGCCSLTRMMYSKADVCLTGLGDSRSAVYGRSLWPGIRCAMQTKCPSVSFAVFSCPLPSISSPQSCLFRPLHFLVCHLSFSRFSFAQPHACGAPFPRPGWEYFPSGYDERLRFLSVLASEWPFSGPAGVTQYQRIRQCKWPVADREWRKVGGLVCFFGGPEGGFSNGCQMVKKKVLCSDLSPAGHFLQFLPVF